MQLATVDFSLCPFARKFEAQLFPPRAIKPVRRTVTSTCRGEKNVYYG